MKLDDPSEPSVAPPNRRYWNRLVPVIGVALLTALVWHFGWREMLTVLAGAKPKPIAAMTVLLLAGFWIRAWKWRYALGRGQHGIGLFFLAKMAGNWSPGRVGELAPLLLRPHRTPRVAAWILADRILEIALTLALGVLGAAWIGVLAWPTALALAGIGISTLLVGGYLILRPNRLNTLRRRWSPGSHAQRIFLLAEQLRMETIALGMRAPLIMLITLAAKITDICAVVCLCRAFGYEASFLLVCAARCAHALVSGIPITPDASGVPYIAAAYLLHEHAAIPYPTLTAALGFEVAAINLLLWLSFLVGLWDLRDKERPDTLSP